MSRASPTSDEIEQMSEPEIALIEMRAVLAALAVRLGGRIQVTPEELTALIGSSISVRFSEDGALVQVQVGPIEEALPDPTHEVPPTVQ